MKALMRPTMLVGISAMGLSAAQAQTTENSNAGTVVPGSVTGNVAPGSEASTSDQGLADIVVTAQRRASSVQSTAAAVSAYGAADLIAKGVGNLENLATTNPSLNVSFFQGEAQVYIRGIGTPIVIGGTDSSTAIHSDGVFLSRSAASIPAFFDVDRVEVIRGPQGTLYGRNSTAGAINVISKGPTRDFEGEARATVGNYNHYQLFGAVGGPISDRVRFRVAAQINERDGWTKVYRANTDPSGRRVRDRAEDASEQYFRAKLEVDLAENLTWLVSGDYYRARDKAVVFNVIDLGYSKNGYVSNPAFVAATDAAAARGEFSRLKSRELYSDIDFYNHPEIWGVSSRLNLDLGGYTVTSLTAFRKTDPLFRDDLDFSTANASDQVRGERDSHFSQEFQISSPSSDRLQYIVGLFYFNERDKIRNEYFLATVPNLLGFAPAPSCCLLLLNGTVRTTALAAYTDGSFKVNEGLSIRFGARYSYEKRDGSNNVQLDRVPAFNNIADFKAKSFKAFTPKLGVEYRLNQNVFAYASATRGFKSGGFNPGSYQNDSYDPEKIWSYEIGGKFDLFDRRLRLNVAGFYYDYTDLQVQDVEQNNVRIENAATATVKGIEIEGTVKPSDSLLFDFSAAYLDSKFKKYVSSDPKYNNYLVSLGIANPSRANCPAGTPDANLPNNPICPFVQNLGGSRLPKAPKWKFTFGGQYTYDLGDHGSISLRGDYSYQSRIFFGSFQDRAPVASVPALYVPEQKGYSWLKARMTYTSASKQWYVAAFVDNIADKVVATNIFFTGDIVGARAAGNLAPPRTYGLEAGFNF